MPSVAPSGMAVFNALLIGCIIPLFSSIAPIKRGLSKNLTDSLDTSRSKSKGVLVSVINSKVMNKIPYLIFGTTGVVLGIMVYYGLPSSLLKLEISVLLYIFFTLLLGMLVGLVMFAMNL